MNPKSAKIATFCILCLSSLVTTPSLAQPKKMEFYCSRTNDMYPATMLGVSGRDPLTIVVWKNKFGNMSPKQRCETISPLFQKALRSGDFNRLVSGVDRKTGQGLICASKKYGENQCDSKRMLFAVNSQQDAKDIIRDLYQSMSSRVSNPVSQSSSSESIDLQELVNSMSQ
jgi:Circadian oscillating protein COP23